MSIVVLSSTICNAKNKIFPNCRTITGFFRKVTSALMYGSKRNGPNPFPALNKNAFIERYNSRPKNRRYGETPSKYEYEQHFKNDLTLYFFGNDDPLGGNA